MCLASADVCVFVGSFVRWCVRVWRRGVFLLVHQAMNACGMPQVS